MRISEIKNRKLLAEFLGIPYYDLLKYVNQKPLIFLRGINFAKSSKNLRKYRYIQIRIRKRNPRLGYRTVYKVNAESLTAAHKAIDTYLRLRFKPNEAVQGFVAHKNISSNAKKHLAKKVLLNIDLKNFFESIPEKTVSKIFNNLGFRKNISKDLARLCTLNGFLAQGFIVSPMLANFATLEFDNDMLNLASKCSANAVYTRYADDITISSNDNLPSIKDIKKIAKKHYFQINDAKTKIMFRGEKQFVTGLTVFDAHMPRIPKRRKRIIRLELYYMRKFGPTSVAMRKMGISWKEYKNDPELRSTVNDKKEEIMYRIRGWIDFINSIEPKLARKFYSEYEIIKGKEYKEYVQFLIHK